MDTAEVDTRLDLLSIMHRIRYFETRSVDRYISREFHDSWEFHDLEVERVRGRVWQWACRSLCREPEVA
jgi:hypothetical protein